MQKNIGTSDRIVRFILALAFFTLAYWQSSVVFLIVGLFTLYETLVGWCLFYQIIGKNTCPIKKE